MKTIPSKKKWSFVLFVDKNPLMYYPYYFITRARCKATALLLSDIMHSNRICLYDSRHFPELFNDLMPVPNDTRKTEIRES